MREYVCVHACVCVVCITSHILFAVGKDVGDCITVRVHISFMTGMCMCEPVSVFPACPHYLCTVIIIL